MIITCPQCETRYQTDASKFMPSGRTVRCAKCGHKWHQEPETATAPAAADAVAEVEPPPVVATAVEEESKPRSNFTAIPTPLAETPEEPKRSRLRAVVGWLGLLILILLIGWAAVTFRQAIVASWPQSASLYAMLGLDANAEGVAFADVTYARETEDGAPVLAVSGRIVNVGHEELPVPPIRVALTDNDKRELYHWSFSASVATLNPGQAVPFTTRLPSPPPAARHLELRFTKTGE
ncbi:MAG TPA: DUF3426 domain-containing protein [Rhizomicrobium sp.]|jgi:predicted Zn finger-like uncharacterized protein|nr:DUF3426 domain-containing protein [Rhizomicrobium sp.]